MLYFYSGNHSNYATNLYFNIFMPKISSGGQFIFIKIMSWPAAKSTGANTECKVCRASYSGYFFSFFKIKILDSMTTLWVMIWILCCSTSPEINRIMLAKNLVLRSVKSHSSDSDFIMAFPELYGVLMGGLGSRLEALVTQCTVPCLLSQKWPGVLALRFVVWFLCCFYEIIAYYFLKRKINILLLFFWVNLISR